MADGAARAICVWARGQLKEQVRVPCAPLPIHAHHNCTPTAPILPFLPMTNLNATSIVRASPFLSLRHPVLFSLTPLSRLFPQLSRIR